LKLKRIPVEKLIAYENNARVHSPEHVEQIAKSINKFGFNVPILIDTENNIIAGHGRLLAAELLALKSVPTIRVDHLTEEQRKAYIIADNRIALNSTWDEDILKDELQFLSDADIDLTVLGFEDHEIDEMLFSIQIDEETKNGKILHAQRKRKCSK